MKKSNKGFTLAELLIVVAIIAVLVAIAIPIFTSQLEKSREAVDLANVRGAYAKVMNAAIVEDTSSPLYEKGMYYLSVPLKQAKDDWTMNQKNLVIGGIPSSDTRHWLGEPTANGSCKVYYFNGETFLNWGGQDHINIISARDFLTKEILTEIVGDKYGYSVINSNETEAQGGGTAAFLQYAREHGFDLAEDYGAATWQIYAKEPGRQDILTNPAIYWSTLSLTDDMVGKFIPVMGYRYGKYDVYRAEVVTYNDKTDDGKYKYNTIKNNFASVKEGENGLGGSATFQFDNYEDAKAAYDKILEVYNKNKTIEYSDLKDTKNNFDLTI